MFSRNDSLTSKYDALSRSTAIIEFTLDGTILHANENFLKAMGYNADEIIGKHHSMFATPSYSKSDEYKQFWEQLRMGKYFSANYQRIAKGGREVWIQASYNPVLDKSGKPVSVIKFATDTTNEKRKQLEDEGQLAAIGRSQAVISFTPDGAITHANENFLKAMGYTADEIIGKHHSMFAKPEYAQSAAYAAFWERLRSGQYMADEFQRFGKGGSEIWIQASYNPILDTSGKVFKVVKFATDITQEKLKNAYYQGQIKALHRSQAVIEFEPDGTIITANENFLATMGYPADEITGKHHSMFAKPEYAQSDAYREFWEQLRSGQYLADEFQRFGKGGREVWIQASYNPILNTSGHVFKVVKFATDITQQMQARVQSGDLSANLRGSIQAVAAAAEQLTASVGDISRNMATSSQSMQDITAMVNTTNTAMESLQQTSNSMEDVINLIRNIAGQVNLLALNATIEAARAGEAGKGFAVVAAEVKNLANQVGKATDDIAGKISQLQTMCTEAARSASAVNKETSFVNEAITSVASAIEEQSAVTKEISINMQQANNGISSLGQCIDQIARRK